MADAASPSAIELLVIEIGGQRFGLRSGDVREVIRAVSLSAAPQSMSGIEGVINLRGRVVPVVDIRSVFRLSAKEVDYTEQFVVCQVDDRLLGLRADRTIELRQVAAEDLEQVIDAASRDGPLAAIAKVPDGLILVLDASKLLPRQSGD